MMQGEIKKKNLKLILPLLPNIKLNKTFCSYQIKPKERVRENNSQVTNTSKSYERERKKKKEKEKRGE